MTLVLDENRSLSMILDSFGRSGADKQIYQQNVPLLMLMVYRQRLCSNYMYVTPSHLNQRGQVAQFLLQNISKYEGIHTEKVAGLLEWWFNLSMYQNSQVLLPVIVFPLPDIAMIKHHLPFTFSIHVAR